ncbi:MAG: hypothetical protein P8012_12200, partial [Desulfobacterales bacterium]
MTVYPREWLGSGVIAGVTTAAVVIPKAMAYVAILAFVPFLIIRGPIVCCSCKLILIIDHYGKGRLQLQAISKIHLTPNYGVASLFKMLTYV